MSIRMYHINPSTGVPTRCYAKSGCLYGGRSGMSNHYKTFTEAQVHAQEMMEDQCRKLPAQVAEYGYKLDEMIQERTKRDSHEVNDFLKLDKDNQARTIRTTDNKELLMGVINGEVGNGDWEVIGPTLQNKNISEELLEEILFGYPDVFTVGTRKWAITNKSLKAEDLREALNDEDDGVKSLLFANGNLERGYLNYVAHDKRQDPRELGRLPYAMIFFDERNRGINWVDHLRDKVEASDFYDESVKEAKKLFNKYIKPNMDD